MKPKKKEFSEYLQKTKYNERIHLKTGMFLHTYCPKCNKSLIQDNMVCLIAMNNDGTEGTLELSPYLNVHDRHSDLKIKPGAELKDLKCPHCEQSIVYPDKKCDRCNSSTAQFLVAAVHQKVPVFICLKEGCHWHGMKPEDEQLLILDSSDEW